MRRPRRFRQRPDPEENISDDSASSTGDFGVSAAFDGPYLNDGGEAITSPKDERVVEVEPGGKFYVQVDYEDLSGITATEVNLANSNPEGLAGALDPTQGFFTLGQPTDISEPSGCDLSSRPTGITCVHEVQVASDTVNITELENRSHSQRAALFMFSDLLPPALAFLTLFGRQ